MACFADYVVNGRFWLFLAPDGNRKGIYHIQRDLTVVRWENASDGKDFWSLRASWDFAMLVGGWGGSMALSCGQLSG